MIHTLSDKLHIAIEAAKIGAQVALSHYQSDLTVERKEDKSVVTIADREAEDAIKTFIASKLPDQKFHAEESGGTIEDGCWIIDPIDGSRSFTRGIPTWCILIAYWKNGTAELGVCYFPVLDLILYAETGKGAYCNDEKIHVSGISTLSDSLIGYGSLNRFTNKQVLLDLLDKTAASRAPDPTYTTSLVAMGKMDAMIDTYGYLYDIAPFLCIIPEAGGKITNVKGGKRTESDRGAIITNGHVHEEILQIVNQRL